MKTVNTAPVIFDKRRCGLGESPVWHPVRRELFWVDLPGGLLLSSNGEVTRSWEMDEMVSAVAWIDQTNLLLASESGLYRFDVGDSSKTRLCELESDIPGNRSNDGRADPWGGFCIGTMGKEAESGAGCLYRWYRGELRALVPGLSIPNAICVDRDRLRLYFGDSENQKIWFLPLCQDTGWPVGEPELFVDLSPRVPDGAVLDRAGCLWVAVWDSGEVVCLAPDGKQVSSLSTETPRPTCPAFGGERGQDLLVTTAAYGLDEVAVGTVDHGTTLIFRDCVEGRLASAVLVDWYS